MASATPSHSSDLRIVLLGKNGAEISSVGNMILGREAFKEKSNVIEVQRGQVEDRNISVIDTPGFFNPQMTDEDLQNEMMKSISLAHPGPHVFLLTVNLDTFTEDDVRKIVQKIEKNFGAHVLKFTLVLFIRERMSNREWMLLKLSKTCQDLISHFRDKYHEINSDSDTTEITTLVEKLDEVVRQNNAQHYSNENYAIFPTIRNRGGRDRREKVLGAKTNQRISSHEYNDFDTTSKLEIRLQGRNAEQNLRPCAKAMFVAPPCYKSNIRSGAVGKNATSNTNRETNLFREEIPSIFNDHTQEHHTYEMCQELLREYVVVQEKERDKLRRTEEQRSGETMKIREEELRTREEEQRKKAERELKNREEELRTRGEEQRKKEERELQNREEKLRTRQEEQRKKEERLLMKREEDLRTREEQRKKEEGELKKREKELRTREDEQRSKVERELNKREEQLRNREEEQRKKEEREQKKREEELRTREDEQRSKVERELNKREEELRNREEEQRKKEERDNLKTIFAEMRMTELERAMHMKRTAVALRGFIAASAPVKETITTNKSRQKTT